jgi:hypothetical protein
MLMNNLILPVDKILGIFIRNKQLFFMELIL